MKHKQVETFKFVTFIAGFLKREKSVNIEKVIMIAAALMVKRIFMPKLPNNI